MSKIKCKKPVDRVLKLVGGRGALEEFERILRDKIVANHDGSFSITKPPN